MADAGRRPFFKYKEEDMEKAIEAVKKKEMSFAGASKAFSVPRVTLMRKVKEGKCAMRKMGPPTVLNEKEESRLVQWIGDIGKLGFPLIKDDLLCTVKRIMDNTQRVNPFKDGKPGKKWFDAFLNRHAELKERVAEQLTASRACVTEKQIRSWFAEVKSFFLENSFHDVLLDPIRIFNADESAFNLCPKSGKVLSIKGEKNVYEVISVSGKESLTVLITVRADGLMVHPFILYPYIRIPAHVIKSVPDNWATGKNESGWMTKKNHLDCFVPNTTHILQPCAVSVFRPMKVSWKNVFHKWRAEHSYEAVTKQNFAQLFSSVTSSVKPETIQNGFRISGLFLFDADSVNYSKCAPTSATFPVNQSVSVTSPEEPLVSGNLLQTRNETTPSKTGFDDDEETTSSVSSPFKKDLLWPEKREKTKNKGKTEKIPSVITSNEWKKYCMKKEKKTEKEQEKKKNHLIQTETETEECYDNLCDDTRHNIVFTDSDDDTVSNYDTSLTKGKIDIKAEMYYAVHYDDHLPSVGRVISIQENLCQMKFQKQIMENSYNWPSKDDIQDVNVSFILHGPIKLMGNGSFTIDQNQLLKIRAANWVRASRNGELEYVPVPPRLEDKIADVDSSGGGPHLLNLSGLRLVVAHYCCGSPHSLDLGGLRLVTIFLPYHQNVMDQNGKILKRHDIDTVFLPIKQVHNILRSDGRHDIQFRETDILSNTTNYFLRLFREAIEIHKHTNNFNRKEEGLKLNNCWHPVLKGTRTKPTHNDGTTDGNRSSKCGPPQQQNTTTSPRLPRSSECGPPWWKQAKITETIMKFIVEDNLPFSIVEGSGFKNLMKVIIPHYEVPSRRTIKELIDKNYEAYVSKFRTEVASLDHVALMTDIRTDIQMKSFLGVTLHFPKEQELNSANIGVHELSESHTAEYVGTKLIKVLDEFRVPKEKIVAVVTDNGANMVKAVVDTFGKNLHIPCFAHTRTPCKVQKAKLQRNSGISEGKLLKLILDVKTRWNSTFYMLERFLKLIGFVGQVVLKYVHAPDMLTSVQKEVQDIINLLRPLEAMTKQLSSEKYVTICNVIPLVQCCRQQLSKLEPKYGPGKTLKEQLLLEFERRFGQIEQCFLLASSTLLDPRFKNLHFKDPVALSTVMRHLRNEIATIKSSTNAIESSESSDGFEDGSEEFDLWQHHKNLVHIACKRNMTSKDGVQDGLSYFMSTAVEYLKLNPIKLWDEMKSVYPNLCQLAMKVCTFDSNISAFGEFVLQGRSNSQSQKEPSNFKMVVKTFIYVVSIGKRSKNLILEYIMPQHQTALFRAKKIYTKTIMSDTLVYKLVNSLDDKSSGSDSDERTETETDMDGIEPLPESE
ncbi:hypothetical protein ANN_00748 [Periplaneta americana]|uniref:HTH CENPB-type domain-containing protein n=1 Tax=Periplaneta americana TaxID=6978 RepID=A0ABQ8TRQ4_PERAM|nr:hypothetical protein ANN_00748 [Periplaneta americana]